MQSDVIAAVVGALVTSAVPSVLVLVAPQAYGMQPSSSSSSPKTAVAPHQPPSWVFRVVWPVLFALLGAVLGVAVRRLDAPVALVGIAAYVLLLTWPVVYNTHGKRSATLLFAPILMTLLPLAFLALGISRWAAAAVAAVAAWCIYALTLSVSTLERERSGDLPV